jgi:hypothetical protein
MTIFATPDFGASSVIGFFLLIVWVIVAWLVLVGVLFGMRLLRSGSPKKKTFGGLLLLASGLIPLSSCLGPPYVIRLVYGNYPLGRYPNNKIGPGMSADKVVEILGTPHKRHKNHRGGETWYYWIDSFGAFWFAVDFEPDGYVIDTHGN